MAQCIICKATIPDGTQYCDNCYSKVKNQADESYLDHLLSSVTSSNDSQDNTRKRTLKTRKEHKEEKRQNMNDDIFDGVPKDYNIFSKSDDDSDLDFLNDLFDNAIMNSKEHDAKNNQTLDIDSESLPEITATQEEDDSKESPVEDIADNKEEIAGELPSIEDLIPEVQEEEPKSSAESDPMEQTIAQDPADAFNPVEEVTAQELLDKLEPVEDTVPEEATQEMNAEVMPEVKESETEESEAKEQEVKEAEPEKEVMDSESELAASLLNELNLGSDMDVSNEFTTNEPSNSQSDSNTVSAEGTNSEELSDSDQDILDLINEINNSEELPPVGDVTDQSDKSGSEYRTESDLEKKHNSDIGDVFSDALSAVSTLKDKEELPIIDDDLLSMIPDISDKMDVSEEKSNQENASGEENQKGKKTKKKRRGLFARIFGNIKEERTEEEIAQLKQQVIEEGEKKEAEQKAKEEAAKQKKEQAKLQKAENAKKAKEEAAKKKQEKQAQAKAKKEEKAQRSREIQELIDEIDENEGKINKVGAGIIFALFAAVAVFIVVGTNIYSYNLAIKDATKNFGIQHYNEAYKNVYGIDIKDEDIEIYDKIMTVMFVNKQLNSYENYYNMKMYPEALDSLLKGLERYDKYYSLAGLLGIESDLDYVRNEILEKLDKTFDVSLQEADALLAYNDQTKYSEALYDLLSKRVKVTVDSQGNKVK